MNSARELLANKLAFFPVGSFSSIDIKVKLLHFFMCYKIKSEMGSGNNIVSI